ETEKKYTRKASGCSRIIGAQYLSWNSTMPCRFIVPANSTTPSSPTTIGISYDTSMAMTRIAPNSEYLLFDEYPAMKTESAASDDMPRMYSTPTSRSASVMLRPHGSTAMSAMPGTV